MLLSIVYLYKFWIWNERNVEARNFCCWCQSFLGLLRAGKFPSTVELKAIKNALEEPILLSFAEFMGFYGKSFAFLQKEINLVVLKTDLKRWGKLYLYYPLFYWQPAFRKRKAVVHFQRRTLECISIPIRLLRLSPLIFRRILNKATRFSSIAF